MYSDKKTRVHPHYHIVCILVTNEPGVLTRVSSMFFKRGFNIDTLTVSPTTQPGISRITVSFYGDDDTYEQLTKQLNKLIDVIKVSELLETESVVRDLCLVKIKVKDVSMQNQLLNYCQVYSARVAELSPHEMIIEIVGSHTEVDAFIELARGFGIREISRTGVTAMAKMSNFEARRKK